MGNDNHFVGIDKLLLGLAFVTLLLARLASAAFAQALHPRRLLQPVGRRRRAAIRTVQSELVLQFGDPHFQGGKFRPLRSNQRDQFFLGRFAWRFAIIRFLNRKTAVPARKTLSQIRSAFM